MEIKNSKRSFPYEIVPLSRLLIFDIRDFFSKFGKMISIETTGAIAVKNLRLKKLRSGSPFMINSNELLPGHCYLEYPNGKIVLATLEGHAREFTIIRELSDNEAMSLRLNYGLSVPF